MEKEKDKNNNLRVLLNYAGSYKVLTFIGLILSAISMLCSMVPYICIWLVSKQLIDVAPNWTNAQNVTIYGWLAFAFAVGGILIYFLGLMCTHLAAFRTASNIRKQGVKHVTKASLGYFDSNASGLIRGRLDAAAAETETLLAHNLADIIGTIVLFISMLIIMFIFDWRMGAACVLAAVISVIAMFSMMGGKNAKIMAEYQAALDRISKAGTEYVRGIPVVKIFQQTVYSFKAFKDAIEDYSVKAEHYQADICRKPQSINLTFTEGAFVFLVPVALFLSPDAISSGNFAEFIINFAFYAAFSAIISTALAKIMFAASGIMLANTALGRRNATDDEVIAAAKAANCDEFVNRLAQGYNTLIGENGSKLSGGERQRISIARALLKDAPIVLLDEATASLDVKNETKVQEALSRLLVGKTVLVIAHRMRTIEAADKIIVLADGKVVEQGSPNELISQNGLFSRMVKLQQQSSNWKLN